MLPLNLTTHKTKIKPQAISHLSSQKRKLEKKKGGKKHGQDAHRKGGILGLKNQSAVLKPTHTYLEIIIIITQENEFPNRKGKKHISPHVFRPRIVNRKNVFFFKKEKHLFICSSRLVVEVVRLCCSSPAPPPMASSMAATATLSPPVLSAERPTVRGGLFLPPSPATSRSLRLQSARRCGISPATRKPRSLPRAAKVLPAIFVFGDFCFM